MFKSKKTRNIVIGVAIFIVIGALGNTDNKTPSTTASNVNQVSTPEVKSENKTNDIFVEPEQPKKEETQKEEPKQEIENTQPSTETKVEEPKQNDVSLTYIGNKSTHKFHKSTCGEVNKMAEKNKIALNSRDEAINEGYVPCQKCNP